METVTLTADLIFEEAVAAVEPVESKFDAVRIEERATRMAEIVGELELRGLTVERVHRERIRMTTFSAMREGRLVADARRHERLIGHSGVTGADIDYARAMLGVLELATLCAESYDRTGVSG